MKNCWGYIIKHTLQKNSLKNITQLSVIAGSLKNVHLGLDCTAQKRKKTKVCSKNFFEPD